MNIHPPTSWLVGAVDSIYDLDNILLAGLPSNEKKLSAGFELENILIEGSCADNSNGRVPPRGLQLNLGDSTNPHQVDTLVMSNLGPYRSIINPIGADERISLLIGYYQLKSLPGVWNLQLGDGRHSEVYRIVGGNRSIPVIGFSTPNQPLFVRTIA